MSSLDQSEIDNILKYIENNDDELPIENSTDDDLYKKNVKLYDFKKPEKISKDQIRNLKNIHEKIFKNFTTKISNHVRTLCDIDIETIEQLTYSEFLMSLSEENGLVTFNLEPCEGKIGICFNYEMMFSIIEMLQGRKFKGVQQNKKHYLTDIDWKLFEIIIKDLLLEIQEGYSNLLDVKVTNIQHEDTPFGIQMTGSNEAVIFINCNILIDNISTYFSICYPINHIESLLKKLNKVYFTQKTNASKNKELLTLLSIVNLPVQGIIGEVNLTVNDFNKIKEGDFLILESKNDINNIDVYVSNVKTFYGELVIHNFQKSCLVTKNYENETIDLKNLLESIEEERKKKYNENNGENND